MASAYIKLVPESTQTTVTLDDVKNLFNYYKEITNKTGEQLSWEYREAAFPYDLKEPNQGDANWFYLKSNDSRYNTILLGVGKESANEQDTYYIQLTLPEYATHGDKGKANEFAKFLAKKLSGELHLFNARIMYFYKRK
ncbi:DUF1885 family protein [Bacillus timonensis]|nr:DUF1885 family protein [Bacillus timonensis]